MPMPTGGLWPPRHVAPAYEAYRDWDAWYSGEVAHLDNAYAHRPAGTRIRTSQYAGGLVGRAARFLWGTPPTDGQRDTRLHVPLPADLAATSARLLFAEPPKLTHENAAVQKRLEALTEQGITTTLLHAAEAAAVLGDVYLRSVVDAEVSPNAILAPVHADAAVPVIRYGHLVEVTLWSTLQNDSETVRLLEHHTKGRIEYALFVGDLLGLGRRVPLTEHPAAEHLAKLVDSGSVQSTGLDRLAVIRVPHAGPQRRWRTAPGGLRYYGRSDFDGNESLFDRLDEVWGSWMRDIRLARGRITIPEWMLTSQGAGKGATWDPDREVYSTIMALPNQTGQGSGVGITATQFNIRHAEHRATSDALVEQVLRHAGLSGQTMGDEGDVAMTATEAQARERQSFVSRGAGTEVWGPAIVAAVADLLGMEAAHLGGVAVPDGDPINIEWGDSVSESPEVIARTMQLLHAAEAISIDTKVRMVHPDWDDPQVTQEVQRIRDDLGKNVQDPGTFTGGGPPPPGQADPNADPNAAPPKPKPAPVGA